MEKWFTLCKNIYLSKSRLTDRGIHVVSNDLFVPVADSGSVQSVCVGGVGEGDVEKNLLRNASEAS